MPKVLKTEGIVLKKRSLPSNDIIITFFSNDYGKIGAFAKGIKKITSKRLPHIQTGNLVHLLIQKKDDRFYLQETTLISAFSEIKKNSSKMNSLYFFFYIIDRLLPENQKEEHIYKLTKKFLIELSNSKKFSVKQLEEYTSLILSHLGYVKEKQTLLEQRQIIQELLGEEIPLFSI